MKVIIRRHHSIADSCAYAINARSPSIDSLCGAFGITPAEARVLAALVAGQSPKQHAGAQGVSVHTVRSQLGSLMAKMGCTRQVELVRKALLAS